MNSNKEKNTFTYISKLPNEITQLIPEAKSFEELIKLENKLDRCLHRKKIEIEEVLRSPPKIRRKMRVMISSQFYPEGFPNTISNEEHTLVTTGIPAWELRVEGRLVSQEGVVDIKKYKFSSFFKSLVIELDRELYGPDSHLVEWNRSPSTVETDGFQVRRPGDQNVKCSILMLLQHHTNQYRLDPRFARLLGFPSDQLQQNRSSIIRSLWSYIKRNKLQDAEEPDFIRPNQYLGQLLDCVPGQMIRFTDIPTKIQRLLFPPDPIVISHVIQTNPQSSSHTPSTSPDQQRKRVQCYHIDVEIDDPLKEHAHIFIETFTGNNQIELEQIEDTISETMKEINEHYLRRVFFSRFAEDPQEFIDRWLASQCRDLKHMSEPNNWEDLSDEERRAGFYSEQHPWLHEAIGRYIYGKIQLKRQELDKIIDSRRQIGSNKN